MRKESNHQVRIHSSFDDYLANLGSETRRTIKRQHRRFFEEASSRVERITEPGDVAQLLEWIDCVYRDSWQAKTFGDEQSNTASGRKFLEKVAAQGWLRSYVLMLGDEPICFKHGMLYRGVLYSNGTAFRRQFESKRPGTVLIYSVLSDLHAEQNVEAWDFGFGDMPYKRSFCNVKHDAAVVYFVPGNRWRLILRFQQLLNTAYDGVRSSLIRLKIDKIVRKLVKRQQ
jgi:CelD/BcsL family acetyltransferase involved in cellulose biosynthesis